jgi:hypothetical protein
MQNAKLIDSLERRTLLSVITVTTTADSSAGSLRDAIVYADAHASTKTIIDFQFSGSGAQIIKVLSPLPTITAQVDIQGGTDSAGDPRIILDGQNATAPAGAPPNTRVNGLLLDRSTPGNSRPSVISGLVIEYFSGDGIYIGGDAPTDVYGCHIGIDITGTRARANKLGIGIVNSGDQIGMALPGSAYVTQISGNLTNAIQIDRASSEHNTIVNCLLGPDITGTTAVRNGDYGVSSAGAYTTIGGSQTIERNLISYDSAGGIYLTAPHDVVLGNYIGTDITGTQNLMNFGYGIELINSDDTQIGNGAAGGGNLVSTNLMANIEVLQSNAVSIVGNKVGTNAAGTAGIENQYYGEGIDLNTTNATVTGNLIGGNSEDGVGIFSTRSFAASGNLIAHNDIGTNGKIYIPNGFDDIGITGSDNLVFDNDIAPVTSQTVTYPVYAVDITGDTSVDNAIIQNSIAPGAYIGIQLATSDHSNHLPNHTGAVAGPNDDQNYPVLSSALVSGKQTSVTGTLSSAPNTSFYIEFFSSSSADPDGYGPGQTPLGHITATTDGSGNLSFNATVAPAAAGQVVTATATVMLDATKYGDTSEFSKAIVVERS